MIKQIKITFKTLFCFNYGRAIRFELIYKLPLYPARIGHKKVLGFDEGQLRCDVRKGY